MRLNSEEGMGDVTAHLQPLVDDDVYLTALSEGNDPFDGKDDLTALLLELRSDIETDVPSAAEVDEVDDTPVDLETVRARRRSPGPWLSGLVGAAAATVVIVGAGCVLYNASPGSTLWGPANAVFGDRTAVVELASTIDELETANENGDKDAVRRLFSQARELLGSMNASRSLAASDSAKTPAPGDGGPAAEATVTVTHTAPAPAPASAPAIGEPATTEPTPEMHGTEPTAPAVRQTATYEAPAPAPRPTQSAQPTRGETTTWSETSESQPTPTTSTSPQTPPSEESDPAEGPLDQIPGF